MRPITRATGGTALAVTALLTLAACGSGGSSATDTSGSAATGAAATGTPAGIHAASTSLGQVLVDGAGRTLYLLTADSPGTSTCNAACLSVWPAVTPSSAGTKPAGVTAKVASTKTSSGASTVTVGGWPLHTFAQDSAPGDVNGEGIQSFGGTWYAIAPNGTPVKGGGGSTSGSDSSSTGGNGYGY